MAEEPMGKLWPLPLFRLPIQNTSLDEDDNLRIPADSLDAGFNASQEFFTEPRTTHMPMTASTPSPTFGEVLLLQFPFHAHAGSKLRPGLG
jgi:hypothetical protein